LPIKQFGTMNGVAYQVSKETEGSSTVWRFRFDRGDGSVIPIELRGDDVRGDLTSGDEVEISINEKDVDETAIQLKRIVNLSTGYNVQVWDKSAINRIVDFTSQNVVTAAIAALVTAGMSFLLTHLGGGSTNNTAGSPSVPGLIINPAASSRGQVWALYAVLAALFEARNQTPPLALSEEGAHAGHFGRAASGRASDNTDLVAHAYDSVGQARSR
jgi:hypothetical protein